MGRSRRIHSAKFKATVALGALKGDKTFTELCEKQEIQANQITAWKNLLLAQPEVVFLINAERNAAIQNPCFEQLQAKIGEPPKKTDQNTFEI